MKNPFNIMYGMIPTSLVGRSDAFNKIMSTFTSEDITAASYIITGIRGSGKTVLLRSVAKEMSQREGWVVIDLNPQGDFVSSLAEKLYEAIRKNKFPFDWSIDLSLAHITFHLSKQKESVSAESAIPHLLDVLMKKGKRILLLIDEINTTKSFKFFANFYQNLISSEYQLFLLMTGLQENVGALISGEAASFLARCPKIVLDPLDLASISRMYQKDLGASKEAANELAKLTQGYAFAYQVIGKLCFENKKVDIDDELLNGMDSYLSDNGYNVIWKGMTGNEKNICIALAKSKDGETSEVAKIAGLKMNNFNNYRARMIYKGYLVSSGYGKISFSLPRFKEYVLSVEPFMN